MDKIKNFFDDFTFHARVMPIMVVSLPILFHCRRLRGVERHR